MTSAERNPKIGGVCSRTCLGLQWLQIIFISRSHHDAEDALELSKAGGAFYWVSAVPGGAVITHCQEITSYLLQFSQAFHFSAEFRPGTGFECCSVLLNSCSVPHLSGPPSILENKPWIRRGRFIHPAWNIAVLTWVCRGHLERSLQKCLNTSCSFSSSVPAAARIHTHSHHIFCHSVGTVVLPAWVLLQSNGEEGRKAAVFSVRWSLVNKCK